MRLLASSVDQQNLARPMWQVDARDELVPAEADTVCFASHGSGPNTVIHGEILEYGIHLLRIILNYFFTMGCCKVVLIYPK